MGKRMWKSSENADEQSAPRRCSQRLAEKRAKTDQQHGQVADKAKTGFNGPAAKGKPVAQAPATEGAKSERWFRELESLTGVEIKGNYEFDECWIVSLKEGLTITQCNQHLVRIRRLCIGRKDRKRRPAMITDVLRHPHEADVPEIFVYMGHFPLAIVKMIRNSSECFSIEPNRTSELLTPSFQETESYHGVLDYMSQTEDVHSQHAEQHRMATSLVQSSESSQMSLATIGKLFWRYRGPEGGGEGATVVVMDSGLDPRIVDTEELDRGRIAFYDVGYYVARLMARMDNAANDEERSQIAAAQITEQHYEGQSMSDLGAGIGNAHGTNVALLACSSLRGAAPKANLIAIHIAVEASEKNAQGVLVKTISLEHRRQIYGYFLMLRLKDEIKAKAVLNCSFGNDNIVSMNYSDELRCRLLNTLHSKYGVQMVNASGNSGIPLYDEHGPRMICGIPASKLSALLPYFFVAGYLDDSLGFLRAHLKSNWLPGSPRNMIWVPLFRYLEWRGGTVAHNRIGIPSASYSAPLLTGVIACILAKSPGRHSFSEMRDELEKYLYYTNDPALGSMAVLRWHQYPDTSNEPLSGETEVPTFLKDWGPSEVPKLGLGPITRANMPPPSGLPKRKAPDS